MPVGLPEQFVIFGLEDGNVAVARLRFPCGRLFFAHLGGDCIRTTSGANDEFIFRGAVKESGGPICFEEQVGKI